jgi:hypothetical protein
MYLGIFRVSLAHYMTIGRIWIRDSIYLHNSQITTATAKLFQPAVASLAIHWQRLFTVEILQLHALRSYVHNLP